MDKKTFTDPALIKYLNENFHVVKFNAEQKEPVSFRGKTYNWSPWVEMVSIH
jgi:thioredoxin-related protein